MVLLFQYWGTGLLFFLPAFYLSRFVFFAGRLATSGPNPFLGQTVPDFPFSSSDGEDVLTSFPVGGPSLGSLYRRLQLIQAASSNPLCSMSVASCAPVL